MTTKRGFTLMEMMIVVILIGIITAFAIPNYRKAIRKARERDALAQLMAIHAANLIYKAQTNEYYQSSDADINTINTALGINIISNGLIYSYVSAFSNEYYALAEWPDGDNGFTVKIDQSPIVTDTSSASANTSASSADRSELNPCCYNNSNCPSLPQCP